MWYCSSCQVLCEENICPLCGKRKLRQPKENDPVLLSVVDTGKDVLLEEILQENDIPYQKSGNLGSALTLYVGVGMEKYRFYVPYGAYQKSRELLEDLLAASAPNFETENSLTSDNGD